jgi:hypothetical protein
MLATLATASPLPLVRVVSHAGKDCTGDALVATYLSKTGSSSHCFRTGGQSLQNLESLSLSCPRGFVTAFKSDDCDDPDGGFLFRKVWVALLKLVTT